MGRSKAAIRLTQPTGMLVGLTGLLSAMMLILLGCSGVDVAGVPQSSESAGVPQSSESAGVPQSSESEQGLDVGGETVGGSEGTSRVSDGKVEKGDDDEEEEEDPGDESDCRFFQEGGYLAFTTKPRKADSETNIDHFPPAQYPMPVHETFDGEWKGDSYVIYVPVDIRLSYNVKKVPYHERYRAVTEGMELDPAYERRIYKVTILNAMSAGCTPIYELTQ